MDRRPSTGGCTSVPTSGAPLRAAGPRSTFRSQTTGRGQSSRAREPTRTQQASCSLASSAHRRCAGYQSRRVAVSELPPRQRPLHHGLLVRRPMPRWEGTLRRLRCLHRWRRRRILRHPWAPPRAGSDPCARREPMRARRQRCSLERLVKRSRRARSRPSRHRRRAPQTAAHANPGPPLRRRRVHHQPPLPQPTTAWTSRSNSPMPACVALCTSSPSWLTVSARRFRLAAPHR